MAQHVLGDSVAEQTKSCTHFTNIHCGATKCHVQARRSTKAGSGAKEAKQTQKSMASQALVVSLQAMQPHGLACACQHVAMAFATAWIAVTRRTAIRRWAGAVVRLRRRLQQRPTITVDCCNLWHAWMKHPAAVAQ